MKTKIVTDRDRVRADLNAAPDNHIFCPPSVKSIETFSRLRPNY